VSVSDNLSDVINSMITEANDASSVNNVINDNDKTTGTGIDNDAANKPANGTKDTAIPQQPSVSVSTAPNTPVELYILVNNTPVVLKNKPSYIFVDILDFYPFDTSKAGGTELVMKINGVKC